MQLWVDRGCPPNKLVVGIPFYGVSFNTGNGNNNHELHTNAVGAGDPGKYTEEEGTLAYYEVSVYTPHNTKSILPYNFSEHFRFARVFKVKDGPNVLMMKEWSPLPTKVITGLAMIIQDLPK